MDRPGDGDSSDEGVDDFTTTNVLLGYASEAATEDPISQLGGQPVGRRGRFVQRLLNV